MPQAGQPFNPYKLFRGVWLPEVLVTFPGVSAAAKICYARLLRYAGDRGECWPGQQTLADSLGVTPRQVQNYLGELEDAELIARDRRGLGKTNRYTFLWHTIFDAAAEDFSEAQDQENPEGSFASDTKNLSHQSGTIVRDGDERSCVPDTKGSSDPTLRESLNKRVVTPPTPPNGGAPPDDKDFRSTRGRRPRREERRAEAVAAGVKRRVRDRSKRPAN